MPAKAKATSAKRKNADSAAESESDSGKKRRSQRSAAAATKSASSDQEDEADGDDQEQDDEPPAKKAKKNTSRKSASNGSTSTKRATKKRKSSNAPAPGLVGRSKKKKNSNRMEVMTEVPNMKTVMTYKPFPSFKAPLNDGKSSEFRKGQAVFVLPDPEGMEDPEAIPRQEEHWIGIINDIRAHSVLDPKTNEWTADPDDVWVVVSWFYKPVDVAASGAPASLKRTIDQCQQYFGSKELIRTEDKTVISVFSCCEPCPVYEFKDTNEPEEATVGMIDADQRHEEVDQDLDPEGDEEDNPNYLHAAQRNFFYRVTFPDFKKIPKTKKGKKGSKATDGTETVASLPLHCVCKKPYCPALDVMRFCLPCRKWYHISCMEEWTEEIPELESPAGELPHELEELARFPIARGGWWGIGGNLNVVTKAKEMVASGEIDDWESKMALAGWAEWKEFISTMERTEWKPAEETTEAILAEGYVCPECETRI